MSRPVIYAQLRETFFIPGMKNGNFGPTLPMPNVSLKNFKLTLQDNGDLLMEWEEGNFAASYTVNSSNIKGCKHPAVPLPIKAGVKPNVVADIKTPAK